MPIVLAMEDPPKPTGIDEMDVVWHVHVSTREASQWRAKCTTFDEAIELADGYRKRYYVTIESEPRTGWVSVPKS